MKNTSQTSPNHRVVVTGTGLVTPVGNNVSDSWAALTAGQSGIGAITHFDATDFPTRYAGEVKNFDPASVIPPKEVKKCDRFIHLGWAAADEALKQSGLLDAETGKLPSDLQPRAGAVLGSGIGGLPEIERTLEIIKTKGIKRVSPFFIPAILTNLFAGQVSIAYGLKGVNICPVSACATGAHAIGQAMHIIRRGEADVIVAGGAEASISPLGIAGFAAARALSNGYNDNPEDASRPFDTARDGFVMGEGAGVMVLESEAHAKARGATILGYVSGFGQTGDASHITLPAEDGDGGKRAMLAALTDAHLQPSDVGYINAHATSTPQGDVIESRAIQTVFGDKAVVSGTKSMTGHMLGAAGGAEAVFSLLALMHQTLPPTINVKSQDENCPLDCVPNQARKVDNLRATLSNSFGFGGTNASLIFTAS